MVVGNKLVLIQKCFFVILSFQGHRGIVHSVAIPHCRTHTHTHTEKRARTTHLCEDCLLHEGGRVLRRPLWAARRRRRVRCPLVGGVAVLVPRQHLLAEGAGEVLAPGTRARPVGREAQVGHARRQLPPVQRAVVRPATETRTIQTHARQGSLSVTAASNFQRGDVSIAIVNVDPIGSLQVRGRQHEVC